MFDWNNYSDEQTTTVLTDVSTTTVLTYHLRSLLKPRVIILQSNNLQDFVSRIFVYKAEMQFYINHEPKSGGIIY